MVDDPASHARGPRAVEVDGSYLRRIVGEEEIAIDGGKHGHQKQRTDAQGKAQRIEGGDGGGLGEEHDAHHKQGHGKRERGFGYHPGQRLVDGLGIARIESAAHPCDSENGNDGIDACGKHTALRHVAHLDLAHQHDEDHVGHHDHLDSLRHRDSLGAQLRLETEQHDQGHTEEENPDGVFGLGARHRLGLSQALHILLRTDQPLSDAALILRIVLQRLADTVLDEGGHKDGHQRSGYTDHKDRTQLHSRAAQEVLGDDSCRGCRDRGTRNAQRGRNDSQTQRTLGPNLIGLGYLADDGQQRIASVGRTRHQAKKPGAERTIIGDMVRMLAQEDRRLSDEIFQSARSL